MRKISPEEHDISVFLDYEVCGSWWASWIGFEWGQNLSSKYFAWKVRRKYARYKRAKNFERLVKASAESLLK